MLQRFKISKMKRFLFIYMTTIVCSIVTLICAGLFGFCLSRLAVPGHDEHLFLLASAVSIGTFSIMLTFTVAEFEMAEDEH